MEKNRARLEAEINQPNNIGMRDISMQYEALASLVEKASHDGPIEPVEHSIQTDPAQESYYIEKIKLANQLASMKMRVSLLEHELQEEREKSSSTFKSVTPKTTETQTNQTPKRINTAVSNQVKILSPVKTFFSPPKDSFQPELSFDQPRSKSPVHEFVDGDSKSFFSTFDVDGLKREMEHEKSFREESFQITRGIVEDISKSIDSLRQKRLDKNKSNVSSSIKSSKSTLKSTTQKSPYWRNVSQKKTIIAPKKEPEFETSRPMPFIIGSVNLNNLECR